jgi:hypothetical protein
LTPEPIPQSYVHKYFPQKQNNSPGPDVVLLERMSGLEKPNGVVNLKSRDTDNHKIPAAKYVRLPTRTTRDSWQCGKETLMKRVQIMETVLDELGEDANDTILKKLNCRRGYTTVSNEGIRLSLEESYALMKLAGSTINQLGEVDRFIPDHGRYSRIS